MMPSQPRSQRKRLQAADITIHPVLTFAYNNGLAESANPLLFLHPERSLRQPAPVHPHIKAKNAKYFGYKKGLRQLPKSLIFMVELIRIELTTS